MIPRLQIGQAEIAWDDQILKEAEMVGKFVKAVRKASFGSDFEHYFSRVSLKNAPYSPTAEEAKRDYRSAFRGKF